VPTPAPEPAPVPAAKPTPPVDLLRLAPTIETPIGEPRKAVAKAPEATTKLKPAPAAKPAVVAKAPKEKSEKSRVERRDRALTPEQRAEVEFRRAVDLLKRGRSLEAEAAFNAALKADPRHRGARQALVALAFERSELESARRLLSEGLAVDPAQPDFAVALARIHVEEGQLESALAAMQPSAESAGNYPEFYVLKGTILQRLRRSNEAADAYRAALRIQARLPQAWIGLGMSLEALEKRAEAAEAFRRALASGPVSADVRSFAEQRIRALR
jgi:MSHA biogenesis protein MshN